MGAGRVGGVAKANRGLRRARAVDLAWDSEEQFAATVVAWLRDMKWDVYQEVETSHGGNIADIVAVREPLVWVVETKLTYSLELLWQAREWKGLAHYVSVAVPHGAHRSDNRRMTEHFCRLMGLGLLVARTDKWGAAESEATLEEWVGPALDRGAQADIVRRSLTERHRDYAMAGNAKGLRYTPFRATCDRVREYVQARPGVTMKDLVKGVETHYHSSSTARSALAKWIQRGIVQGVRAERDGRVLRLYPAAGGAGVKEGEKP